MSTGSSSNIIIRLQNLPNEARAADIVSDACAANVLRKSPSLSSLAAIFYRIEYSGWWCTCW